MAVSSSLVCIFIFFCPCCSSVWSVPHMLNIKLISCSGQMQCFSLVPCTSPVRLLFLTLHADVQSPLCSFYPEKERNLSPLPQHGICFSFSLFWECNVVLVGTAVPCCITSLCISLSSMFYGTASNPADL